MANRRDKALALAQALLTPDHIHIVEKVVQEHLDKAIADKAKDRLKKLYELVSFIDDAKAEAAK